MHRAPPRGAPRPTWANPQSLNPANSHINSKQAPPRGARQRYGSDPRHHVAAAPVGSVCPSLLQMAMADPCISSPRCSFCVSCGSSRLVPRR
uniref:Uncharacterized protein n=1 Tax=Arundo donax TaxID=35708 RepID=A0A0A9FLS1_ARUDO